MKKDNHFKGKLLDSYYHYHDRFLVSDEDFKFLWFEEYVKANYLPYMTSLGVEASILEIGCNRGYILKALSKLGFSNLWGIDLSRTNVELAIKATGLDNIVAIDAFEFLTDKDGVFDLVIMKAVLEHIDKSKIGEFLCLVQRSLKEEGLVIIDVPNMRWLFSPHERYMDFTHEVGFTSESLAQVMRVYFKNVQVHWGKHIFFERKRDVLKRKIAQAFLGLLFRWAEPQGYSEAMWVRSIIGIGKK